jgi:hypothetical protein
MKKRGKRTQSEVIATVLLILVSIVAVVIVGNYVINLVKNNLKSTDCFATSNQLSINQEYSYFNSSLNLSYLSINRGEEDFNLTGILISIGNADNMKSTTIMQGKTNSFVLMKDETEEIDIPKISETRAYIVNFSNLAVSKVKLTPVVYPDKICKEGLVETDIKSSL